MTNSHTKAKRKLSDTDVKKEAGTEFPRFYITETLVNLSPFLIGKTIPSRANPLTK